MATAVLTKPTFTLADRLRIQQERSQQRDYIVAGKLTSLVFEGQRSITGLSQSKGLGLDSFSEKQRILWSSITLDWLNHKNAPVLAVSRDHRDLLLPNGLTPLPDIPDPRWLPKKAGDIAPRLRQALVGCPVVGDRACGKLTARDGRVYLVIQPISELCLMLHSVSGGFGRIRGLVDPADGTHLALLIDPEGRQGYFVGGMFTMGM
jgi:hypothetical protein